MSNKKKDDDGADADVSIIIFIYHIESIKCIVTSKYLVYCLIIKFMCMSKTVTNNQQSIMSKKH